jgi:hypothetical protein
VLRLLSSLTLPLAAALLLGGCASQLNYSQVRALEPPVAAGKGRIYVYRNEAWLGNLVTPDVTLDGKTVGVSNPGAFFFVDRDPGSYQLVCGNGDRNSATIALAAGAEVYVRTSVARSVVKSEMIMEVVQNTAAVPEIAQLKYVASAAP